MYPYIVCFCGRSLGDIYDLFKALRAAEYATYMEKNHVHIDPDKIQYSEEVIVYLREVFETLHIDMQCCKARLLTQVEYKHIY